MTRDSEDGGGDPERFFFSHLQKTGGTSLFLRLRQLVGASAMYPDASDGDPITDIPQMVVDQLLARWAVRKHEIRIISGHFPLCTTELLGVRFRTLTVLREPVHRTLSYLRHHRELTVEDGDKSLEEIYEDPFRFDSLIHNHMVKMFSLTPETMTAGMLTTVPFSREHLDRAKAQLATVDVIGLQERFDAFWTSLERTFGWDLGPTAHANRTQPVDGSQSFRDRIAADNQLDVEFYDYACGLVAERSAPGR